MSSFARSPVQNAEFPQIEHPASKEEMTVFGHITVAVGKSKLVWRSPGERVDASLWAHRSFSKIFRLCARSPRLPRALDRSTRFATVLWSL